MTVAITPHLRGSQNRLALGVIATVTVIIPGAGGEERWVTVGRAVTAAFLLVVHTHVDLSADRVLIRIISARRPSRNEIRQYEDEAGP